MSCSKCGGSLAAAKEAPQFTRTIDKGTVAIPQREPARISRLSVTSSTEDEGRFVPGTLVAGRYRVIGLLGRGGMGEVYRATDLTLGQSVALKFLPEDAARDERVLERFHNEVRTARQVTHPNVCRVYDIGEADGLPFISMEYVDGEDLASLLQRIGRVPADKALEITRKLCLGLAAAHDRGIIHRDLKPHNIMLNKRGDVVIMDFGLAAIADHLEGAEARSGTVAYMAPEQLRGDSVSAASDLYSLGLIAYELFTGKRAFEGDSMMELLHAQETSPPRPISEAAPDVDPSVELAVMRCLDPEPRNRPAGGRAVVATLPGGDPLAAALAAGETPSPELVAASGRTAGMRTRYAVLCLLMILAGLMAEPVVTQKTSLYVAAPMDFPPAVLEQKARDIGASFGFGGPAADWKSRFRQNGDALEYLLKHRGSSNWTEVFRTLSPVEFWYRQSPQSLLSPPDGSVQPKRPALDVPGMSYILLDSRGRLRHFEAVAARYEVAGSTPPKPVEPSAVFTAAGLEFTRFTEAAPSYTPTLAFDTRLAWSGPYPGNGDAAITVEMATWRGAVTSFFIRWPWTKTESSSSGGSSTRQRIFTTFFYLMCGIGLGCAALFARRNLRLGRGDRKGALRIACAALLFSLLESLSVMHIAPDFATIGMVFERLSVSFLFAAVLWLMYIALEPSVRARWPHTMVTWSRLTAGQWRDPAVASHVLLGTTFGVTWLFFFLGRAYMDAGWLGPDPFLLGGMREVIYKLSMRASSALLWGSAMFFLLCGIRALVRSDWAAVGLSSVLLTFFEGTVRNSTNLAIDAPLYFLLYVAFTSMLIRAGQLPAIVSIFVLNTFADIPVSGSFNAWFNWIAVLQMTMLISLAVYAFVRSQAVVAPGRGMSTAWRATPRPAG